MICSVEVKDCDMYNRYRNAAQSSESRKVDMTVAFVIGGIFDNRKLIAILDISVSPLLSFGLS